jgi:peptidoglycan hydrolase-like protein with peptidoglycan-binding domain
LLSTTLKAGAKGNAVKALQRALGGVAVDGAYGPKTVAAVKAFQKAHGLATTGVTDTAVWQALEARDYPLRAYYSTVLRPGSRGAAVVALQRALALPADGFYGARTTAAVKALQGRARLTRTGVVATLTWQALEAELRRR